MIRRIRTIIRKEWAEVFKNRMVLFTVTFLPVLLTILPIAIFLIMKSQGDIGGEAVDIPASAMRGCGNLNSMECVQYFMMNQFLLMFMIMPIAIPVSIAAYSIVGEKTTRSLEPLLATPITTSELLAGKSLAAGLPAIAATWICFLIFWVLLPFVGLADAVRTLSMGIWFSSIFMISPLMAMMAVVFALIVSSRVTDPRAAEQISMVIIVPVVGVMLAQLTGIIILDSRLVFAGAAILALADLALLYAGVKIFGREEILTKWR